MKKRITVTVASAFALCLAIPAAWADDRGLLDR